MLPAVDGRSSKLTFLPKDLFNFISDVCGVFITGIK